MLNLGSTTQTAKRVHRCENCAGWIKPGQVYVRARIVDGGEAWVWKSHDYCQQASELLFSLGNEGDDGSLPLVTDYPDEIREIAPELAKLIWEAENG